MATSLAEQLRRLKVPQTSVLIDSKVRHSIIFDKKEAATKDRKTIFQLGQSGISELSVLNPAFTQFEKTLFDPHSVELERSVEDSEVNRLINKAIKKFFYHLSPYFMLQPAHFCLEWLIRRFHIHQFNIDEFIDLILPYHETKIFVRCLQTMNLRDPNGKWIWLNASLKAGVPLSKTAVQSRAAEDAAFLRSICNSTLESIRELDNRSNTLQTKINFYCITVIAALENAKSITETHISCILPSLLKGFSSNSIDFSASSFMITAQLMSKVNLKRDILQKLLSKICKVEQKPLQVDILLLLILIYQSQNTLKQFPEDLLINFISKKSVIPNIKELSERNTRVSSLCVPLIKGCFDKIYDKDQEWVKCQLFLTNLFDEVRFQEHESKIIIRSILECNQNPKRGFLENDVVELNSDDENELLQEEIKKMYSSYLYQLEKQYPSAFDEIVKEIMHEQTNISEKTKQALKSVLAFRLKSSYSEDSTSIYENLYHPNSVNRIAAIKYINQNFDDLTLTNEGKAMIKDSLADRLSDDDQRVLVEILKICTDNFLKIMDIGMFLEKLIEIFNKCNVQSQNDWFTIKKVVVEHMTNSKLVQVCDPNRILITLLPLIVSDDEKDLKLLKKLSKKESMKFIPFLNEYFLLTTNEIPKTIDHFEKIMQQITSFPTPESILKTFENINERFYYNSINCTFMLLFLSLSFSKYKTETTYKLQGFQIFEFIEKRIQLVPHTRNFLQVIKPNKISLSVVLNFLLSLLKDLSGETRIFTNQSEASNLLRKIFQVILNKAFSEKNIALKEEYGSCLKNLLKQNFHSSTEILDYLSFYFIHDRVNKYNIEYELQIRAIKLFNCIITGNNRDFMISRNMLIKIILGLSSSEPVIRKAIIETLYNIMKLDTFVSENDLAIVSKILVSDQEILMDEFQITIVFYTLCCSESSDKRDVTIAREFLNFILNMLNDDKEEILLKALLLNIMKLTNNTKILENVVNLGCKILEDATLKPKHKIGFDSHSAEIYKNIAERFDSDTIIVLTKNKNAWNFIENSLMNHNTLINLNGKIQSVASVIMSIFDKNVYSRMPIKYKEIFLRHILVAMSNTNETTVPITGSKLIKRLQLDGNHIKHILIQMKELCGNNDNSERSISLSSNVNSLNSIEWKIGITLLELLQNIKNIENAEILIPLLFDLLNKCLEFEEQVALDYTKQLILSCLINLSQRIQELDKKPKYKFNDNTLRMDLVVQCIRSTQNPQTHHHALMLLSHFANIVPQQILHNITNVFTFMGSSVVRQDDSFTFQILINVIESVIPMLVESRIDDSVLDNKDSKVIPILKVFSDIILDVPEHRRLLLYTKLIKTLNAKQYLWMFLCILFESHVVHDDKEKQQKSKTNNQNLGRSSSPEELPKRLSIALQICKDFEHSVLIETCVSLFIYLRKLPEEKVKESNEMSINVNEIETSLFYVSNHTEKQFRHYKFSILQFMSALTSSPDFVNAIANLSQEDLKAMKSYYQDFIIKILSFIPVVTVAAEKNAATNHHKFWKIILYHCTEILDNAISLLSPDMLLVVVNGLLQHELSVVRKKVIELLITKLQYQIDYFDKCNKENMITLLGPFKNIIKSILNKDLVSVELAESRINSNHDEMNIQHLALIAVKLLSRELAMKCVEDFKEILTLLSKILKKRSSSSKIIIAAVVLAISEISSNLKAHSISNLYKFMPHIIEVLKDEAGNIENQAADNITIAILAGIYKLFDSLPLFLGPYYTNVLTLLIKIWVRLDNKISDNRTIAVYSKLNSIWTKISSAIPLRLLTPHCENVYTKLIEENNFRGVIYLMKLLNESLNNTEGSDISVLQIDLTKFFIILLDFRSNLDNYDDTKEINEIENQILQTFVSLILKLSESSFRPLYQKLYDWAIRGSQKNDEKLINRSITYFSLSEKIAETLKSLFVLFAGDFIQDAANLLIKCNHKSESTEKSNDLNKKFENQHKCIILLENILRTLYNIFLHDTQGFINVHRFDILMQPITDHIENPLVLGSVKLQPLLLDTISQMAVAVSNDVSWKQLNYEILLKSRNNQHAIKLLSVNTCIEIAKKLGEDFSSLLPETIPFMAELLEHDNPNIETAGRKAVQELEKVVGESLQKYF